MTDPTAPSAGPDNRPVPASVLPALRAPTTDAPEDIQLLVAMVPRSARSPVNQHPDREAILSEMVEHCINIEGRRTSDVWVSLTHQLNVGYPGLEVQPAEIRRFALKYVVPNLVISRSTVMRAIVERGRSIDQVGTHLNVRDTLLEALDLTKNKLYETRTDAAGKLVMTGSTADEFAALGKAIVAATKAASDEMERYGLVPERRAKPDMTVGLRIDIGGALGRSSPPVDASFRESSGHPESGSPSQ